MISSWFAANKLSHDPLTWAKNLQARYRAEKIAFITLFVVITLAILASTLAIALVTQIVNAGSAGALPDWYRYFPVSVNAGGGFLLALINFFVVKPRYETAHRHARFIRSEILLYEAKAKDYAEAKSPELLLATTIAKQIKFGEGELK